MTTREIIYRTAARDLKPGFVVDLPTEDKIVRVVVKEVRNNIGLHSGPTIIWEKDGMSYGVTSCRGDYLFTVVSDN